MTPRVLTAQCACLRLCALCKVCILTSLYSHSNNSLSKIICTNNDFQKRTIVSMYGWIKLTVIISDWLFQTKTHYLTDSAWLRPVPWGIRRLLVYIKDEYTSLPIMITENGVETNYVYDDYPRIEYFKTHFSELLKGKVEALELCVCVCVYTVQCVQCTPLSCLWYLTK